MITANEIEQEITADLRQNGMELHKKYLGISHVARCSRQAFDSMADGLDAENDYQQRMYYVGGLFEQDVMMRLVRMKFAKAERREVVAPFDDRLRGRIDGLTSWGDLLEIKSLTKSKFGLVYDAQRALHEHNDQVQLYMRYGGWEYAWIIYVCRETFEHKVIRVRYDERKAEMLEEKAKRILAALDARQGAPVCECGYCEAGG